MNFPFLLIFALYAVTPVSLTVFPQFGMAPATFRFLVIVPRDEQNRQICFGYSGAEDRRSCTTMDGANASRVYTTYWHIRTTGDYVADATLLRMEHGREKTYRETQPFRVIGPEF